MDEAIQMIKDQIFYLKENTKDIRYNDEYWWKADNAFLGFLEDVLYKLEEDY